jgi:hypothetical protein
MEEDYLWDKTGSDPEIEKLENALQVFRYKETAPPEIPAKVVSFPVQHQRKSLRFALAAAACIAFGIISLGVWFQILKSNMETGNTVAEINQTQSEAILPDKPSAAETFPVQKPDDLPNVKTGNSTSSSERKIIKVRKSVPLVSRQKDVKVYASKQTKSTVFLTEEEKFAYNQLMLALSITGSKLKIVKDKIEGSDE